MPDGGGNTATSTQNDLTADDESPPYFSLLEALQQATTSNKCEPIERRTERWRGICDMIVTMDPATPQEAMLSTQLLAIHHATMEMLRAADEHTVKHEFAGGLRTKAATLVRTFGSALNGLERLRKTSAVRGKAA